MKKSLLASVLSVFLGVFGLAGVAAAHSVLVESTPGNAQAVPSVDELTLVYNEPVRMLRLSLVGDGTAEIDFGFTPNASARQELSYPLPTLEPGEYVVSWTLIGSDGHTVTDSYTFTIDPTLTEATEAESHDGHHHHHH